MLKSYKKVDEKEIFEKQMGTKKCNEDEEYYQYDVTDYIEYCTNDDHYMRCARRPDNHDENDGVKFERVPLPKQFIKTIEQIAVYPETVLKELESSITRKHLKLCAYNIKAADINGYIIPFLKRHPDITDLNLSGNAFGDEAVVLLSSIALDTLNISFNDLTDVGAIAIAKNTHLNTLIISGNEIGDSGAIALAANTTLKKLDISNNSIGNQGGAALASNRTLEELDIFVQKMNEEGVKVFLLNETLKSLRIHLFTRKDLEHSFEEGVPGMRKEKSEERKMAFLMGTHSRVGEGSPILTLYRSKDVKALIQEVLSYVKPEPFNLQLQ